jgi:ketopantoate reductase
MLQDVESGKPLEIQGVISVFLELAALTGVAVPSIEAVHACCVLLDRSVRQRPEISIMSSGVIGP